jgi:Cupin domain
MRWRSLSAKADVSRTERESLKRSIQLIRHLWRSRLIIEVDGEKQILQAQQGIEITPGVVHQFRNESDSDVTFLVISMPKSHGDRVAVP